MGPKVEAASRSSAAGEPMAVIADLDDATAALRGDAGTADRAGRAASGRTRSRRPGLRNCWAMHEQREQADGACEQHEQADEDRLEPPLDLGEEGPDERRPTPCATILSDAVVDRWHRFPGMASQGRGTESPMGERSTDHRSEAGSGEVTDEGSVDEYLGFATRKRRRAMSRTPRPARRRGLRGQLVPVAEATGRRGRRRGAGLSPPHRSATWRADRTPHRRR